MKVKELNCVTNNVIVKTFQPVSKRRVDGGCVEIETHIFTPEQLEENKTRIDEINKTGSGYLCSACDPLLVLVSYLWKINITHHYSNLCTIKYINLNGDFPTLIVHANDRHFWCDKKENKATIKYCSKLKF
jgi:hypothetical protein